VALSEAPTSAGALVPPEYGVSDDVSHTHAKAGGGVSSHTHAGAIAGHNHTADDPLNTSGVALLPLPKPAFGKKDDPWEPTSQPGGVAASKTGGSAYEPNPYQADPDETIQCPVCGKMNDLDASYCDQCGVKLEGRDDVVSHVLSPGTKRMVSVDERQQLADAGHTFPKGSTSYPIDTLQDLNNAIQAYGRHPTPGLKSFLLSEAQRLKASQDVLDRINSLGSAGAKALTLLEAGMIRDAIDYMDYEVKELRLDSDSALALSSIAGEAFLQTGDRMHLRHAIARLGEKGDAQGHEFRGNKARYQTPKNTEEMKSHLSRVHGTRTGSLRTHTLMHNQPNVGHEHF